MKFILIRGLLISGFFLLPPSSFAHNGISASAHATAGSPDPGLLQDKIIDFARSLTGIRYKYASSSPKTGFDCSGFINYVFRQFSISVPRSSAAFDGTGQSVQLEKVRRGDLILFTGTNPKVRKIGHIGMVVSQPGEPLRFIHSTSGKAYGVTETEMNDKYRRRYMKAVRVIPSS